LSEAFPIRKGVRQKSVCALIFFDIYLSYVFKTVRANLKAIAGVSLPYRDDGNFLNLRHNFETESKFKSLLLLYAYDAVFLHHPLNIFKTF